MGYYRALVQDAGDRLLLLVAVGIGSLEGRANEASIWPNC